MVLQTEKSGFRVWARVIFYEILKRRRVCFFPDFSPEIRSLSQSVRAPFLREMICLGFFCLCIEIA